MIEPRLLTDDQLLSLLDELRERERSSLADIISCLDDIDRRDVPRRRGYSSTFDYCVRRLRYSEEESGKRIRVARAVRSYPQILSLLRSGETSLTNLARVAEHLTPQNVDAVLKRIAGRSTREVEKMVCEFAARPTQSPLSAQASSGGQACPPVSAGCAARMEPPTGSTPVAPEAEASADEALLLAFGPPPGTAPGLRKFSFEAPMELSALLQKAKDLLSHKMPFADEADVIVEAVRRLVQALDPSARPPARERPPRETPTRRIPRWIRDLVWRRDGGRCSYVGPDGVRCDATRGLEFDHIRPWACGGSSDDPDNLRLLCDGHNRLEAEKRFGPFRPGASSRAARPPS